MLALRSPQTHRPIRSSFRWSAGRKPSIYCHVPHLVTAIFTHCHCLRPRRSEAPAGGLHLSIHITRCRELRSQASQSEFLQRFLSRILSPLVSHLITHRCCAQPTFTLFKEFSFLCDVNAPLPSVSLDRVFSSLRFFYVEYFLVFFAPFCLLVFQCLTFSCALCHVSDLSV